MKRASKLWDKPPREIVLCPSLEIFTFFWDTTLSNWIWSYCNPALRTRLGRKYPEVPLKPNRTAMLRYLWVRSQGSLFPHPRQWYPGVVMQVQTCCESATAKLYYTGHQSSEWILSCRNIWLPILCQTAILCLSTYTLLLQCLLQ